MPQCGTFLPVGDGVFDLDCLYSGPLLPDQKFHHFSFLSLIGQFDKDRCIVGTKVGDIYVRHSDRVVYRVKWVDYKTVVLESEEGSLLAMTHIYDLEKSYTKQESKAR